MPAFGLIPDSPFIYYGGKALKYKTKRAPVNSRMARVEVSFHFNGVILYKPVMNFELNNPAGMTGRRMHRMGVRIMNGARRQVGVDTGYLRASIHMKHRGDAGGQTLEIGSSLSYALAHHEGTRPHLITPNPPNKVLTFTKGSKLIRTAQVRHPGTKPNRYLSDQLRRYVK